MATPPRGVLVLLQCHGDLDRLAPEAKQTQYSFKQLVDLQLHVCFGTKKSSWTCKHTGTFEAACLGRPAGRRGRGACSAVAGSDQRGATCTCTRCARVVKPLI